MFVVTLFLIFLSVADSFHVKSSLAFKTRQVLQSVRDGEGKVSSLSKFVKARLFDIPLKTMAVSLGTLLTTRQVLADGAGGDLEFITNKGTIQYTQVDNMILPILI